jgi:hypothetical protein
MNPAVVDRAVVMSASATKFEFRVTLHACETMSDSWTCEWYAHTWAARWDVGRHVCWAPSVQLRRALCVMCSSE